MHEARERNTLTVRVDHDPHRDHVHEHEQQIHDSHLISVKGRCKHCSMRATWPGVAEPCRVAKISLAAFARQVRRELKTMLEKTPVDATRTWEGWRRWLRRYEDT